MMRRNNDKSKKTPEITILFQKNLRSTLKEKCSLIIKTPIAKEVHRLNIERNIYEKVSEIMRSP